MKGLDPREASEPMDKHTARRDDPRPNDHAHHDSLPTWRRTTPRANPEVYRQDLERSTERLEMLLGH
jgi:hypothetical protein